MLLVQSTQPAEMLFRVSEDPLQIRNLANDPQQQAVLSKMRILLNQWQTETGDSVPTDPTPDRQSIHQLQANPGFRHREFAGAANKAPSINAAGPVHGIVE